MNWLESHQEASGGFRGSYGPRAAYKDDVEISWAAKFYLDAHLLRVESFFKRHAESLPSDVAASDGRARAVLDHVQTGDKVLEVGCGKGRFLKAIRVCRSGVDCTGVDPSEALCLHLPKEVSRIAGTLERIPLPDESYDVVFSVEAIEHCQNRERAVAEMVRVCKPGGWVIIIDKQNTHAGRLKCPPWERWPGMEELKQFLHRGCDDVSAAPVAYNGTPASDGLMVAWKGRKRSRLTGAQWNHTLISANTEKAVIEAVRFNRFSAWGQTIMFETAPGEKVLEIGSGTGQMSLQLAQAGRKVTCLDTSQDSLDFVGRCARSLGITIDTACADATKQLPFEDGAFDCVWSSGLLEHFVSEERRAMLREWARVCSGKMVHFVPNAASLAYRIGKLVQEEAGTWPYGLEMPIASLRDDYEAAGIRLTAEFSVGSRHALNFLPKEYQRLRKELAAVLDNVSEKELTGWNQGYLLVTVGIPTH
jgi:ubiquinone/menaquinone biosynthesis C-methylase UbiE